MLKTKRIGVKVALLVGGIEILAMASLFFAVHFLLIRILENEARDDMNIIARDRAQLIETYLSGCCDFVDGYSKTPEAREALLSQGSADALRRIRALTGAYAADNPAIEGLYVATWSTYVLAHSTPASEDAPFRAADGSLRYSLVDAATGVYIFSDDPALVGEACADERLLSIIKRAKEAPAAALSYTTASTVASCCYMADRGWLFVVEDDKGTVFAVARSVRRLVALICILITAAMVALCMAGVDVQMRPLREITAQLERLKRADYRHSAAVARYCARKDEFGTIANAVEELHAALENQYLLFSELLEAQAVGTLVTDAADNKVILINKRAMQLYCGTDAGRQTVTMDDIRGQFDEADLKTITEMRERAKASKSELVYESTAHLRDGSHISLLNHVKSATLSNGETVVIFSSIDISAQKKLEHNLRVLSETDALTAICNRRSGEARIGSALAAGMRGMFCLFDANKFKLINDSYGHAAGDAVLVAIADGMRDSFRNADILVRLGGDEFVVFAADIADEKTGAALLDRFMARIAAMRLPALAGHPVSVSLGAVLTDGNDTFARLYSKADSLMYACKMQGGNAYRFYHEHRG